MKICSKCEEEKLLIEFSKNRTNKDGHQAWCKKCCKIYHKNFDNTFVQFDSYYKKIKPFQKVRRDPKNPKFLQVQCIYCGKWYTPISMALRDRIKAIHGKGNNGGDCNLYCSIECKLECPSYYKQEIPTTHKKVRLLDGTTKLVPKTGYTEGLNYYPNEVDPVFRKMIFERDNWTCQNVGCGNSKLEDESLIIHCHHIIPKRLEPIFEIDMWNGITFCKKCHVEIHKIDGLQYWQIGKGVCVHRSNEYTYIE